jgi:catechol 2,3-dioxygenase-like lactoylglutathione lyase family enzyme
MSRLYSHVDLRVRNRARAKAFYDAIMAPLGMTSEEGQLFVTYTINPQAPEAEQEWFGFTEEPDMVAGSTRLAFNAESRQIVNHVAEAARAAGARNVDGPAVETDYSPNYYAVFFEDPDGNELEVCCLAP